MNGTQSALLVGAILGDADADSLAWSRAIGVVSARAESLSVSLATPLRLQVEIHVDGRTSPNEFLGARTGRFSRAKSLLVIQVALAKPVSDDPVATVCQLVGEAVSEAEAYARRRKIADDLTALRHVVEALVQTSE